MEYREAVPSDTEQYLRLRALLWPDVDPEEERAHVDAMFDGANPFAAVTFLAEHETRLIGFAEISLRSYAPGAKGSPVPFLEGWYVDAAYRNRGVGRGLVEAAERWARAKGFSEFGSDAELENTASAAAHAALGFREIERIRCFLKSIER